jgi:HSP20 family protein
MSKDLIRLMQALFPPQTESYQHESWQPAADIYRTRDGWLVKFDLAGVRPEDIELRVLDGHVTVRGTRRDCTTHEGCRYYRLEIAYSRFERTIELPCRLDQARLTTEYRDGMLLVHLSPTEESRESPD